MAIYTVDFTVTADGVTPSEPQAAGVTGDHRAAVVRFTVPYPAYAYRIEIADGAGGYDITDRLEAENGTLAYAIPSSWTAAGIAALRVVGVETDENGEEAVRFHSAPAYVRFEDREDGETLGAAVRPVWQETLDEAQLFLAHVERKLKNGELNGPRGDKGDKGDTGAVAFPEEFELFLDGGNAVGEIEGGEDDMAEYGTTEVRMTDKNGNAVAGVWEYQKWNTGIAECWGSFTKSVTPSTDWNVDDPTDHYYDFIESIPLPTDLFCEKPVLTISVDSAGGEFFCTKRDTTASETGVVYVMAITKHGTASTVTVHIHVKGHWK